MMRTLGTSVCVFSAVAMFCGTMFAAEDPPLAVHLYRIELPK